MAKSNVQPETTVVETAVEPKPAAPAKAPKPSAGPPKPSTAEEEQSFVDAFNISNSDTLKYFAEDYDEEGEVEEAKPEPKAEAKPKPEPKAETPAQDAELLSMADQVGIPKAVARHLSNEQLALQIQQAISRRQTPRPADKKADKKETPDEDRDELYIPEEEVDQWAPQTIASIKKIRQLEKELKALREERQQEKQQSQQEKFFDDVDSFFATSDTKLFGEGNWRKPSDEKTWARRQAVVQMAVAQHNAMLQQNLQPPALHKLLKSAVEMLYGELASAPGAVDSTSNVLEQRGKQWEQGSLARPTARKESPEPKGYGKAVRAAASHMKQNGMLDDYGMDDERSGFLE